MKVIRIQVILYKEAVITLLALPIKKYIANMLMSLKVY